MRFLSAFSLCIISVVPAQACVDIAPFRIEGVKNAEAIFIGQPLDFQRIRGSATASDLAFLKVRVHSVLKGQPPQVVRLVWESNFGTPYHLDLPSEVIIAASRERDDSRYREILAKGVDRFERSGLFRLESSTCSSDYILDPTPQNIANIRMIVRSERVPPHDYRQAINHVAEQGYKRRTEAEKSQRNSIRIGVIASVVFALLVSAFFLLRRKRPGRF